MDISRFANVIPSRRVAILVASVVIVGLIVAVWIGDVLRDPRVILLLPEDGAEWLRVDAPFEVGVAPAKAVKESFRATLQIPPGWTGGELRLAALRRAEVLIDDRPVFDSGAALDHWKTTYVIPLPGNISVGQHQLTVNASNWNGPAMIRPWCSCKLARTWEASSAKGKWLSAIGAQEPFESDVQDHFNSTSVSFAQYWPLLFGLTAAGTFILLQVPLHIAPRWAAIGHWVILLMWLPIAARSRTGLISSAGYDFQSHLDYIAYVGIHHRLPLASEGWEFFQAPLYYIISGALYAGLQHLGVTEMVSWLRIIPLASGFALIEITYQTAKAVFPARGDLQLVATLIGGFMPMNLYLSPTLSNEPMSAALTAACVLMMRQFIVSPQSFTRRRLFALGLVLGMALLTKVTVLLWLFPIELTVLLALRRSRWRWRQIVQSLAIVPFAALLISAWFFIHNWLSYRKWIITISPSDWWQAPGYRTPGMFLSFGHVLTGPVYTTMRSVWDSLYGTTWGKV